MRREQGHSERACDGRMKKGRHPKGACPFDFTKALQSMVRVNCVLAVIDEVVESVPVRVMV